MQPEKVFHRLQSALRQCEMRYVRTNLLLLLLLFLFLFLFFITFYST